MVVFLTGDYRASSQSLSAHGVLKPLWHRPTGTSEQSMRVPGRDHSSSDHHRTGRARVFNRNQLSRRSSVAHAANEADTRVRPRVLPQVKTTTAGMPSPLAPPGAAATTLGSKRVHRRPHGLPGPNLGRSEPRRCRARKRSPPADLVARFDLRGQPRTGFPLRLPDARRPAPSPRRAIRTNKNTRDLFGFVHLGRQARHHRSRT